VLNEAGDLVAVAPLVVIPGKNLHESIGEGDAGLGVGKNKKPAALMRCRLYSY